jgi:Multiubiquitin
VNQKPEKTVTIIVGQNEHIVSKERISYDEVVALYVTDGGAPSNEYLIKFSRGHSSNFSGVLAPGQEIRVKDGMHFRVSGTGES